MSDKLNSLQKKLNIKFKNLNYLKTQIDCVDFKQAMLKKLKLENKY